MSEETTGGSTEAAKVPDTVCLVASRFFFRYDAEHGEFRKMIHGENPRYVELREIVNDPQAGVPDSPAGNPHGRILEACDVYDANFHPKGHSVVTVCGGYNGGGPAHRWCEYLGEISGSVHRLADRFGSAWLVRLHEHSDVWYAEIGFEDRRGVPADGSDHETCASDDFLAYDRHRKAAVAGRLPFGLVDWGRRSYDWAWEKLGGVYPFPRDAFHGSLIRPGDAAHRYAAYDADAGRFRDALGVYQARNGTKAFYAVLSRNSWDAVHVGRLGKDGLSAIASVPASGMPLLEDWLPAPQAEDSTAG